MAFKSLKIVMFPWLAFGHIIPFLDLAKLIAQKGHKISFLSTTRNIDRLPKLPPHLASSITLHKIPLPKITNLPETAEATMDIDGSQMDLLKEAFDGLESGVARFLEEARPDWIIYDFLPHWLPSITARLGIPGVFFLIVNAWFLSFFGPTEAMITGSDYRTKAEDFTVPPKWVGFDTKVAYRRFEADWIVGSVHGTGSGHSDSYRNGKVVEGSEAIVVRHAYEFEPQWLTLLEELHGKRVIPLGFMPPHAVDKDIDVTITNWLESQQVGTVVYVALGSEVTPSQDQLTELAHGLELSGVPFLWVLRKASESDSVELPGGFEERTRGRGIVWRSWAAQLKILSHDSVGGFLTHCGWSSIIEGLMFGRPLITLPFLVDQGLNSRVVAERQLGLEISRNEEDGSFTRDAVADSVRLVMVDEEGNKYRDKAREIAAVIGDRNLHDSYINELVQFLENHQTS